MRLRVALLGILAAAICPPSSAHAQSYPTAKPIRMIIPAAAAGASDIIARVTADHLEKTLGQRVIVDSRPGAGGNLGADITAKSPPDGYTLCLIQIGNVAINPFIFKDMPFDALADLAPVAPIVNLTEVVAVNGDLPVQSVKDLVALAKREPGQLNYGSAGTGTTSHLAGVLFELMSGVKMTHVPYRGAAPALVDVAAGQVQLAFVGLGSANVLTGTGKLKVLAVGNLKRLPAAPEIPTVDESGVPGYEFIAWFGIVGPRGLPPDIVALLNRHVAMMLDDPVVQKRFEDAGMEPLKESTAEFARRIRADYDKFAKVVKAADLKPE
ncbi:MAG TPA: tripartite tricarboxylate transporter substrate binding protein [Alphaproteobacteria bacterium]